jgi:hypothetical protein
MLATEESLSERLKKFCLKWAVESYWKDKVFVAHFYTDEVLFPALSPGGTLEIDYSPSGSREPLVMRFKVEDEACHEFHTEAGFERLFAKYVTPDISEWRKGVAYYRLFRALDSCHAAGLSAEGIKTDVAGYWGQI